MRIGNITDITEVSVIRLLANVVLVSSLLPYVSPIPTRSMDVQLMADVIAFLVLLLLSFIEPWRITVCKEDLVVAGLGFLMLFYANFSVVPVNLLWLRSCGTMLFCFPVYFAVRNLYRYMSPWIFSAVVAVYLLVLILEVVTPSLYFATVAHLLSDVRWDIAGPRGPNGLSPEPSMMGDLCILLSVSLYFFHRDFWKRHRGAAWFVIISTALMLVITESATGILLAFAVIFLAVFVSRYSFKAKVACMAAFLVLVGAVGQALSVSEGRGTLLFSSALERPASVVQDMSFMMRFAVPFLAMLGLTDAPLGTGQLSLNPSLVNKALSGRAILTLWPDGEIRDALLEWTTYRNVGSGVGFTIQRMGLFSFLLFGVLLSLVRGFHGQWVVRFFLVAYLFNSSVFVSSLWFVIGCCVALRRNYTDSVNTQALLCLHLGVPNADLRSIRNSALQEKCINFEK